MAQIDPNGLCNAGCWYCPVAYEKNPISANKPMSVETLESIVSQIKDGIGEFVSEDFHFVYTAHYNEVLLYPYFKEMIEVFKKYGFKTMVLTNGVALTPAKVDLIKENLDTVLGICLNVPAADEENWAKFSGFPKTMFKKVISNIQYAVKELPSLVASNSLSIQVNGINESSLPSNGGWMEPLENAPEINLCNEGGDLDVAVTGFKSMFPGVYVYANQGLVDRAGYLLEKRVLSNTKAINTYNKKENTRVVGCSNMGGRAETWIHINAAGKVFICCDDYNFETVFGDALVTPLKDIWMSPEHREMIKTSYKTMCTSCSHAIWG